MSLESFDMGDELCLIDMEMPSICPDKQIFIARGSLADCELGIRNTRLYFLAEPFYFSFFSHMERSLTFLNKV